VILTDYSIRFRTAVVVFTVAAAVFGTVGYLGLPREGTPDITIPFVFVAVPYEGTAPDEMEKLITIPIERQLNGVEGVKEIRSSSAEGICSISVEFMAGEDIDLAKQKVKDKIDLARPDLPRDLDEPTVDAFNFSSDFPVLILALSGTNEQVEARLKPLSEEIKDALELVPGVRQAAIVGTREREIRVELDLPRLAGYGIPLGAVMNRIAGENRTLSAGNIEMMGRKFQVRVPGEFTGAPEMRDMVLAEREGQPVFLRDVATVEDTYKDATTRSRLDGAPCVSIQVKKRTGVNTVNLVREVDAVLERIALPPGFRMTRVMDMSSYIRDMVAELENNIASGFILVLVVLMVFLGFRNSLFVAAAMPLSMLLSFLLMAVMGTSLNMVVLFSLVMATGMLVDNAIVIVESAYRHRTAGEPRMLAARNGTSELAWPVITSTITTVVAFAPLLFWPDIMGQFMYFLPWTLILTLSASLFVGLVINPVFAALYIVPAPSATEGWVPGKHPFLVWYERVLRRSIENRWPVIAASFLVLVLSVVAYAGFGRGTELFPSVEPRNATIKVELAQGASLDQTDAVVREIEAMMPAYEDVQFFLASVGVAGDMVRSSSGDNIATIHVEFRKANERKGSTTELIDRMRKEIGTRPGVEIVVKKEEEGPPTGADVSIELSGDDFDTLSTLSDDIRERISSVPGLVDLQDDMDDALPELQFRVDRQRAALLGMDTDSIGFFLRTAIFGTEASRMRVDEDEFDITVRLPAAQRDTAGLLWRAYIPLPDGRNVPLRSLGDVVYVGGRGAITRKDQSRVVTITGAAQGRGDAEIRSDVKRIIDGMTLPQGYAIHYSGKDKEMQQSGAFLAEAFVVALGLILVVLVLQFNSVLLPAIIMSSIVLSMVGVLVGLLVCRMRFGVIMTGVGVISLAGVVVNNAIVLIDCIIQRRREGASAEEAAVQAGLVRIRPVLLTAITTVLGLIPMAAGWSIEFHSWPPRFVAGAESSAWWAPMAVAVIFGLSLATVLTLVVVPVLYVVLARRSEGFRAKHGVSAEEEAEFERKVFGETAAPKPPVAGQGQ
jgi:CzcA family heavy metal efflux pump